MTGNVVILEPGDEQAQKIAKAIASQTANDILALLESGSKSLSDITEQLNIPLTTAKYHTENLLDAGVITVSETKYSVKGREMKIYTLADRLLIVAPKKTNVKDLLLRYSSLFGVIVAGTLTLYAVLPFISSPSIPVPMAMSSGQENTNGALMYATKFSQENAVGPTSSLDPVLTFLLGGLLVIAVLACYEIYVWKKQK